MEGVDTCFRQCHSSEYTCMLLANNRGKAAGAGNPLDFDEVAKDVRNPWGTAAFNINARRFILHKEIGSRDIVGNHSPNPHRVTELGLIGSEPANLIYAGKQGKRR